jgi:hypothetical protein
MLPTRDDAAVDEIEHDAALGRECLAIAPSTVVVEANHPTLGAHEHVSKVRLERARRFAAVATELGEYGVAADGITSHRADARGMT